MYIFLKSFDVLKISRGTFIHHRYILPSYFFIYSSTADHTCLSQLIVLIAWSYKSLAEYINMDMSDTNLHVVFIPFLAPGHIIPLTQLAKLFAARGVRCTIITTIHNTHMIKTNEIDSGYPLTVHTISFPAADVGLPVGIENISDCVNAEMTTALIHGMDLLHAPMEQLIRDENPDCIFSDMFITWTVDLAEELKIPSLLFYPTSFLCRTVSHSLEVYAPHANVKSESESFLVPNLPDNITIKRSQVAKRLMPTNPMGDMVEKLQQAEKRSYGLVHNTFYEIEPAYADHIKKIKCPKILHLVELLGIGVGIGADVWNPSSVITSPLIRKQRILDAIDLLATSSAMVERIRQNSKELSVKAKKAVEEGGSSLNAINTLTDELKGTYKVDIPGITPTPPFAAPPYAAFPHPKSTASNPARPSWLRTPGFTVVVQGSNLPAYFDPVEELNCGPMLGYIAQFIKWSMRVIAVTCIFLSSSDTPLAMVAVGTSLVLYYTRRLLLSSGRHDHQ
ncbi:hypothetical protein QVD17_14803 [Tagetes erecta]|uniref:Glycosyltransferase n=1 Tax=Tagetes erecta TaxID=13708 RepID=A0AAD8KN42_TARER|nr:hypothetical protein QVD17_14803 [Tagetes erecta]